MTDENDTPTTPTDPDYVEIGVFETIGSSLEEGYEAVDWKAAVSGDDWEEHKARLRSVVDAQQEAEVLGSDVLIGW